MELKRLRYFLQIAADGSLGRASRSLGIAQPALGRQMQMLESELGTKLFYRMSKGMRLTEEGEYLRENIQFPLDQAKIILDNVRSYSKRVDITCALGLTQSIALMFGAPLMRRLKVEMPNLRLSIVEDRPRHLVSELKRGTIDVAILPGSAPDETLFHSPIISESLILVGRKDSALAGQTAIAFSGLKRLPLILPRNSEAITLLLAKLSARTGQRISLAHEVDSVSLAMELVRGGAGFTIIPERVLKQDPDPADFLVFEVTDPPLEQAVHYAVQAHWRVPRGVYNNFHRIFYDEWMKLVDTGKWPASWIYDREKILAYSE